LWAGVRRIPGDLTSMLSASGLFAKVHSRIFWKPQGGSGSYKFDDSAAIHTG
jgi:hypothetical protein